MVLNSKSSDASALAGETTKPRKTQRDRDRLGCGEGTAAHTYEVGYGGTMAEGTPTGEWGGSLKQ